MATKIIKNNTDQVVVLSDINLDIAASASYTIPPDRYSRYAASSDLITKLGDGTLTCNDGTDDLSLIDATSFLQITNVSDIILDPRSIEFSWAGVGAPELSTVNSTYTTMARIVFRGSSVVGTPSAMTAACFQQGTDMSIRVFDVTNTQVIAEVSGIVSSTPSLVDFVTISGVPETEAIWDIQLLEHGEGGETASLSAFSIEF